MATPLDVLKGNQRSAAKYSQQVGEARVRKHLEHAQRELNRRLREAEQLSGPGLGEFTRAQMESVLAQLTATLDGMKPGFKGAIVETTTDAIEPAVMGTARYLRTLDNMYKGVGTQPLALDTVAMLDTAKMGTEASVLRRIAADPDHKGRPGVIDRYGSAVIKTFEGALQQRFLQKQTWSMARQAIVDESPFLQGAPAHWAERVIRTETMAASNRASWEAIQEVQSTDGDMVKILSATFDDRTAADSYAVHGQIRRVSEAFESWFGMYQAPPNRPNDREIVAPHNTRWPIPAYLRWRSDGEIVARWAQEKRKGSPPARPKMTTVPLSKFPKS